MKKALLFLFFIIFSFSLFAQTPKVKFYQTNGSVQEYILSDIKSMNFKTGSDICLIKIFYSDSLVSNFQTTTVESIKFERDNYNNDLINVFASGKPNLFLLAEIDSINFFISKIPVPQITDINPSSGIIGDLITISGKNFGTSQGNGIVSFYRKNATEYISWSDNQIKVKVPKGAASGKLSVTVNNLKSNEVDFNLVHNILSLNPVSGRSGDVIQINGLNLGSVQDKNYVSFNNLNAIEYPFWSDSIVKVKVPAFAKSGPLNVNIGGLKSNLLDFIILPTIYKITPTTLKVGDTLSISGTSFGIPKDSCFVFFNDKKASNYLSMNDSLIKIKIPTGTKNGKLYITSKNIKSNEVNYIISPNITSITPTTSSAGQQISILGSGFGDSVATSSVSFSNSTITKFNSWTDTQISLTIPLGTVSGKVSVSTNGQKSNEVDYKILHQISTISPKTAKIGDDITITGSNFGSSQGTSFLLLGSLKITTVINWTDNEIKFKIPSNANSGLVSVTIGTDKSNDIFLSLIPVITSISPLSGALGTIVTINGNGFNDIRDLNYVSFQNSIAGEYTSWTSTQIVVKVPNGSKTGKVFVKSGDQKSNEVDFTVLMTLIGIYPTSGLIGDVITFAGSSFGDTQGSSYVSFNGANATEYISWTDTEVRVKVPAGTFSGKVSITVNGIKSIEYDFTLIPQISSINPTSSFIGDAITISGSNFGASRGTNDITFNGVKATSYPNWSNNSITVNVPNAKTGKVFVTVGGVNSNEVDFTIKSVIIGSQEWMIRNLNVKTYRNGDAIPECTDQTEWNNLTTGAWCYYLNSSSNEETYGIMYNWAAITDSRGLAPTGWHIPTDNEWSSLSNYVGGNSGALKEVGTVHWAPPNTGATDTYGFTALPGGYRISGFNRMSDACVFWSSTSSDANNAYVRGMFYNSTVIQITAQPKNSGLSVRCIKD
jgi:uncharacterized protein (TIGR02145 family)